MAAEHPETKREVAYREGVTEGQRRAEWGVGWREEIVTALDEWIAVEGGAGSKPRWRRLGRAIRTGDGLYVVDVRGAELSPDRLDGLRLAGAQQGSIDDGFAVMDISQSESTLTVRVAEFADPADPHLWTLQQPPTFLVEALKDCLTSLGSAPLGDLLAHKKPSGQLSRSRPPEGLFRSRRRPTKGASVPESGSPSRWPGVRPRSCCCSLSLSEQQSVALGNQFR